MTERPGTTRPNRPSSKQLSADEADRAVGRLMRGDACLRLNRLQGRRICERIDSFIRMGSRRFT